jgi:hypothetical protein
MMSHRYIIVLYARLYSGSTPRWEGGSERKHSSKAGIIDLVKFIMEIYHHCSLCQTSPDLRYNYGSPLIAASFDNPIIKNKVDESKLNRQNSLRYDNCHNYNASPANYLIRSPLLGQYFRAVGAARTRARASRHAVGTTRIHGEVDASWFFLAS